VDDAAAVRGVEGVGDLDAVAQRLVEREEALLQTVGEGRALEVLQHEEIDAVLPADVVQHADMGMAEGGDRLRLPLEALPQLRRLREVRGEDLQGHGPVEPRVERLVDFAHPARAEGRDDFVGPETRSRDQRHALDSRGMAVAPRLRYGEDPSAPDARPGGRATSTCPSHAPW
jgi:hypothetical protein